MIQLSWCTYVCDKKTVRSDHFQCKQTSELCVRNSYRKLSLEFVEINYHHSTVRSIILASLRVKTLEIPFLSVRSIDPRTSFVSTNRKYIPWYTCLIAWLQKNFHMFVDILRSMRKFQVFPFFLSCNSLRLSANMFLKFSETNTRRIKARPGI